MFIQPNSKRAIAMHRIKPLFSSVLFVLMTFLGLSSANASSIEPVGFGLFHYVTAQVGAHGTDRADLEAQLASMASLCCMQTTSGALMTSESNGFRLAELTKSGVAEGKTGGSVFAKI